MSLGNLVRLSAAALAVGILPTNSPAAAQVGQLIPARGSPVAAHDNSVDSTAKYYSLASELRSSQFIIPPTLAHGSYLLPIKGGIGKKADVKGQLEEERPRIEAYNPDGDFYWDMFTDVMVRSYETLLHKETPKDLVDDYITGLAAFLGISTAQDAMQLLSTMTGRIVEGRFLCSPKIHGMAIKNFFAIADRIEKKTLTERERWTKSLYQRIGDYFAEISILDPNEESNAAPPHFILEALMEGGLYDGNRTVQTLHNAITLAEYKLSLADYPSAERIVGSITPAVTFLARENVGETPHLWAGLVGMTRFSSGPDAPQEVTTRMLGDMKGDLDKMRSE